MRSDVAEEAQNEGTGATGAQFAIHLANFEAAGGEIRMRRVYYTIVFLATALLGFGALVGFERLIGG